MTTATKTRPSTAHRRVLRGIFSALPFVVGVAGLQCAQYAIPGVRTLACPELGQKGDALHASYTTEGHGNAKIAAFVQASKDLLRVSEELEREATAACQQMGADLGVSPHAMVPRMEAGGAASGACGAVAERIDGLLRGGISVRVEVTGPSCQVNAQALANCQGVCVADGEGADAECGTGCRAHGNAMASCDPVAVRVESTSAGDDARKLVATLQANLPRLLRAQLALGARLADDLRGIGELGVQLPRSVGQVGARALACIGASADATAHAAVTFRVATQGSAQLTGKLGVARP